VSEVKNLRKKIGAFPILVGSGTDNNNAKTLFRFTNGAIVSTSLKSGTKKSGQVNVKSYEQRINQNKVKKLIESLK
jgi:predicted TIM-barrel enzyme